MYPKEIEVYKKYVWNYFELHARQRIILFNFYILFFSIFAYAVAHLISRFHNASSIEEIVVIILSGFFLIITGMFYYLDKRNRNLIHNAEDFFKAYEINFDKVHIDDNPFIEKLSKSKYGKQETKEINYIKIFSREDEETKEGKCPMRHTQCFNVMFYMGGALSIIFIIIAALGLPHHW